MLGSDVDARHETHRGSRGPSVADSDTRQPHALAGRVVNGDGEIFDKQGRLIGLVTNGHLGSVVGCTVDGEGYIFNDYHELIGEAKTLGQLGGFS